jgi:hypothetical protein
LPLAVAATQQGLNVLVIDLDPQASAAKWSDRRSSELPVVVSAHASRLNPVLGNARANGGDLVVIDTAPPLTASPCMLLVLQILCWFPVGRLSSTLKPLR